MFCVKTTFAIAFAGIGSAWSADGDEESCMLQKLVTSQQASGPIAPVDPLSVGDCVNGIRWPEEKATGINPPPCQCFSCFIGPSCKQVNESCEVEVDIAETNMNREWFQASSLESVETGGYLMPYRIDKSGIWLENDKLDRYDDLAQVLNKRIRQLHDDSDNLPGGTRAYNNLLLGAGATQLISAAIYAFATVQGGEGCVTTVQRPHWGPYESYIVPYGSGTTWTSQDNCSEGCSIEILTWPNNPDNAIAQPLSWTKKHIYDMVYNWPAFGKPQVTAQDPAVPVAIFSEGKIFGHAPSRLGWAFVQDEHIADLMYHYIWNQGRSSSDAQYRHSLTLQLVLNAPPRTSLQKTMRTRLVQRYQELALVFARGGVFRIASAGWPAIPGFVPSDQQMQQLATPQIVWVKITKKGSSCADTMAALKVRTSRGPNYAASDRYCRMTVTDEQAVWELVLQRLAKANWAAIAQMDVPHVRRPDPDLR